MKKRAAIFLGMMLILSAVLTGCGGRVVTMEDKTTEKETTEKPEENGKEETRTGEKTGFSLISSLGNSQSAGEEPGFVQVDLDMAAVTLDENGRVLSCVIDGAQIKAEVGADGRILTPLDSEFKTKNELGEAYGMKKASSIGKEWKEQAAAFAAYCVGKTKEEIENMKVTEEGKPADADLAASCTLYVGGFQAVVTKAMDNAG